MKKRIGLEQVKKLINLRLSHLREMKDVAKFEGIVKECQCREVESLDVYFGVEEFERAKELLKEWKEDMPEESRDYFHLEKEEANEVRLFVDRLISFSDFLSRIEVPPLTGYCWCHL